MIIEKINLSQTIYLEQTCVHGHGLLCPGIYGPPEVLEILAKDFIWINRIAWSMKYVNNCRKIIIKNWLEPIIRIIKNGKIKLRLLIESLNLEFFGTKKFCHEILFFISVFVALDEKNHF